MYLQILGNHGNGFITESPTTNNTLLESFQKFQPVIIIYLKLYI